MKKDRWSLALEWEMAVENVCSRLTSSDCFESVIVPVPPEKGEVRLREEVRDWWPVGDVERRRAILAANGVAGLCWGSKVGWLATAHALRSADPDVRAAVWIGALESGLAGRIVGNVLVEARHFLCERDAWPWHSRSKDRVPDLGYFVGKLSDRTPPRTVREMFTWAAFAYAAVFHRWVPVRMRVSSRGLVEPKGVGS